MSAAKVIDLDSKRPHFVIECPQKHEHVVSARDILAVAKGEAELASLPDCLMRRIIAEWSGFVLEDASADSRSK